MWRGCCHRRCGKTACTHPSYVYVPHKRRAYNYNFMPKYARMESSRTFDFEVHGNPIWCEQSGRPALETHRPNLTYFIFQWAWMRHPALPLASKKQTKNESFRAYVKIETTSTKKKNATHLEASAQSTASTESWHLSLLLLLIETM